MKLKLIKEGTDTIYLQVATRLHFYQQYFAQLCIIWPILRFPYEFEFYWYFATWTDGTV